MISVGSGAARRNRWALSFADLALLLLGFFVLLQASGNRGNAVLSGVSSQFGGAAPAQRVQLAARDIFQPGEAMLTEVGRAKIGAIMRGFGDRELRIELRSAGFDGASGHYDNWDLAAARLSAVARAISADGVAQDRVLVRGLDEGNGQAKGQQILISAVPAKR